MLGGSKFTYPSLLRRGRLRHKFFIRKCLFCGLSDLHCASVLFIEEVNGFESENGVAVSQTSKVKLGGSCRCDVKFFFFFFSHGILVPTPRIEVAL